LKSLNREAHCKINIIQSIKKHDQRVEKLKNYAENVINTEHKI